MPFSSHQDLATLPSFGHGLAGIMAGTTVSFFAAPVEHIKARLQVQYAADKSKRMYSGPIDCLRKMVSPQETTDGRPNRLISSSSKHTVSAVSIAVFGRLSFSDPSFSSGGAPTTFSPAT